ncbi:TetR/AcrR family transcriptional regulator [Shewanella intestini]|uniref:TetR/AcrR family transcriptional regulator n=1 Tax=Shewanella intestini TaxID=2017544 RepID=A0ABS5HZ66_9GAMM|nr:MULTISPECIES: TetR/AcrR family transcriptional regulator [Shewanella]MBR9727036.1 TetR/AcrR family transcriptional regulator [Shewanella intestini]MRG35837.1 TetR family transcriptional regulator [Shewanella sp. XMDDZSB0408]
MTKQYHHGDLKASLLHAAQALLLRDGAERLSLRAIAAYAGVSHMAPYAHFKNKQALMECIVEAGFVDMANAMIDSVSHLDINNPANTKELVLAYGVSYLEFANQHPELYRVMLGQAQMPAAENNNVNTAALNQYKHNTHLPFNLLRDAFALQSDDKFEVKAQALGAWSMVHGMAALLSQGRIQLPQGVSLKQFLASASSMTFTL